MNAKDGRFEGVRDAVTSRESTCRVEFTRNGEWSVAKRRHHEGRRARVIEEPRTSLARARKQSAGTYISLTMKIVQILGKVSDNLSLTCAKSTPLNQPRLQAALLA